jgi:3-oxoacyl-[acyl-carrier-protein] synthase-3
MTETNMSSVGILGLGSYLPPIVRGNDWWPEHIVSDWRARQSRRFTNLEDLSQLTPASRLVLDATQRYAGDPFEGARERRVTPDDVRSTDMGIAAARDAMARADVGASDIDFLLVQSMCPDYLNTPDGCRIHEVLGLPTRTFTTTVEASCAGFLQQLTIAQGLIKGGLGKHGLLVQCAPMSRILRQADPWSAGFGDGAAAAVVGIVSDGRGILAQAHATDGRTYGGLVTGVPGARWHDAGANFMYVEDNDRARTMVMSIPDAVRNLVDVSLEQAKIERDQVSFIAAHQATIWFGEVIQEVCGLRNARRMNTFEWTTSLSGANLPFAMAMAERDGLLRDGDNVVMFSGATGMTVGALVCRWGR